MPFPQPDSSACEAPDHPLQCRYYTDVTLGCIGLSIELISRKGGDTLYLEFCDVAPLLTKPNVFSTTRHGSREPRVVAWRCGWMDGWMDGCMYG